MQGEIAFQIATERFQANIGCLILTQILILNILHHAISK